jgi:hypothetical protein
LGETCNLALQKPDLLAKLRGFSEQASMPLSEGEIYNKALVDKGRHLKLPQKP